MPDVSYDATARPTESGRRLHAAVRAVLSPGVWLVLASQVVLIFSLQWRAAPASSAETSILPIILATTALMLFFYLQAGTFHALALDRRTVSAGEVVLAGRAVFAPFLWLTVKAGLLFALVINALVFLMVLMTGHEIKTIVNTLVAFFNPMTGVAAFVFVYWLPFVFARREFRLLPSLRSALRIAWVRLSQSPFLALLVLAPILVSELLPADIPLMLDLLASLAGTLMGWIAYIYCLEVLQDDRPDLGATTSA